MTTYTYKNRKVYLKKGTYATDGTLAVEMYTAKDNDLYTVITVNLCSLMQTENMAFLDTNNNPGIGKWLEKNGIAKPLCYSERSGFCEYPLYLFSNE